MGHPQESPSPVRKGRGPMAVPITRLSVGVVVPFAGLQFAHRLEFCGLFLMKPLG